MAQHHEDNTPLEKGWYDRGHLPHLDTSNQLQNVSFRLHDAVPAAVMAQWKDELRWTEDCGADSAAAIELRRRVETYEDTGRGACYLRRPEIAALVQNALKHFDGERYELLTWCIMPNHVHVLFQTYAGFSLDTVVHSWKSFTAQQANKTLGRRGPFWMREYFDRYIRDAQHLKSATEYIRNNPVTAGLAANPDDWPWSGWYDWPR